jgi:hypothetical protein
MIDENESDAWADRMNAEFEAATDDAERLSILEKYMSPDQARTMLSHLETGSGGTRDTADVEGSGDGRESQTE